MKWDEMLQGNIYRKIITLFVMRLCFLKKGKQENIRVLKNKYCFKTLSFFSFFRITVKPKKGEQIYLA